MKQTELVARPDDEAKPQSAIMLIERMMLDDKCDPAKLEKLLAVKREWEADEARKMFSVAIAQFQRECPLVHKADQGAKGRYADMARIWNTIKPHITAAKLSITWESCTIDTGNVCRLKGHLRHAAGHAEPLEYMLPIPEAIQNKEGRNVQSAAQVMGSATTYAKRYALCNALGIQTGDDNDMDAPSGSPADGDSVKMLRAAIVRKGRDEKKVCDWKRVSRIEDLTSADVSEAMAMLAKLPDAPPKVDHELEKLL